MKIIVMAFAVLLMAGCGSSNVLRPNVDVSLGQQLIDLKKAHDSGALSKQEYAYQKRQLIENAQ